MDEAVNEAVGDARGGAAGKARGKARGEARGEAVGEAAGGAAGDAVGGAADGEARDHMAAEVPRPQAPRFLSPRECARLMGFPETFILPSQQGLAYRQPLS